MRPKSHFRIAAVLSLAMLFMSMTVASARSTFEYHFKVHNTTKTAIKKSWFPRMARSGDISISVMAFLPEPQSIWSGTAAPTAKTAISISKRSLRTAKSQRR